MKYLVSLAGSSAISLLRIIPPPLNTLVSSGKPRFALHK